MAQVYRLFTCWQEAQEQGRDVPLTELCADCPELLGALESRVGFLRRMRASAETEVPGVPVEASTLPPCGGEASPPDSAEEDAPLDFLRPAEQPNELGRLGPYRVLKVLGKGGQQERDFPRGCHASLATLAVTVLSAANAMIQGAPIPPPAKSCCSV